MRRFAFRRSPARSLFAVTLAVYAIAYLIWVTGHHDSYIALLRLWGIDVWHWPFLDLETMLSWSDCRRLGVDVFAVNGCTTLGLPANYGPVLAHMPFTRHDTQWIGISQAVAFLACAAYAVQPRTRAEWVCALLALLSSTTVFALERGNLDVIEFVLIAMGAMLAMRTGWMRYVSYALYFAGGVLKFYPFALFLQVVREKPKAAIAAAAIGVTAIGLYAWTIAPEISRIMVQLPGFSYNDDTFGGRVLPYGLADTFALPAGYGIAGLAVLTTASLLAAAVFATMLLKARPRLSWSNRRLQYLTAGSIVMAACFLLQTNYHYRAIFLLFMLPGLFDLRNAIRPNHLRTLLNLVLWGTVFCLWGEFIRRLLSRLWQGAEVPSLIFFVVREAAWWGVMTAAFAVIIIFLRTAPGLRGGRKRPA